MKIFLYNIAYGTGLNGSWKQYFLKVYRYIWLPLYSGRKLTQLIKKQDADIFCFLEIDVGSLRNRFCSQVKKYADILKTDFYYSCLKYHPKSFWRYMLFFRKQHDAIVSKLKGEFKCHYLKTGMKKLVQEFKVKGVSIFTVHLAVILPHTRKKQLEELGDILKKCTTPYILCGDFNIHKGLKEVQSFLQKTGLQLMDLPATFPSHNPKMHLDLFFVSEGVKVKNVEVIESQCSDHLPVLLEIEA